MKPQTFRQRLSRQVNAAVRSPEQGVTFPYGFATYARCAAKCNGKKLKYDWR